MRRPTAGREAAERRGALTAAAPSLRSPPARRLPAKGAGSWRRSPHREDGECKRRDDRGDRMDHPIIGKLRLRRAHRPQPQPSAMPPAPSKKSAGLRGARPARRRAPRRPALLCPEPARTAAAWRARCSPSWPACTARDTDAGVRGTAAGAARTATVGAGSTLISRNARMPAQRPTGARLVAESALVPNHHRLTTSAARPGRAPPPVAQRRSTATPPATREAAQQ